MDGLLFLGVLIGTTWLCVWSLQDHRGPKQPWSPFDARHIGDQGNAPEPSGRRTGPPPPWRRGPARRGVAGRPTPEPPPWRRRSGS